MAEVAHAAYLAATVAIVAEMLAVWREYPGSPRLGTSLALWRAWMARKDSVLAEAAALVGASA